MLKNKETIDDLHKVMEDALLQLRKLVQDDISQERDFLSIVKLFLLGVISTSVDLVEVTSPGATPLLYADIEAAAKLGGLRAIKKIQSEMGSMTYSVSNIAPDDIETAMNYLGKELSTALYKSLYDLPPSLRTSETLLRGIEALMSNLLNQKFDNPHQALDRFCEHVHRCLDDLGSRGKDQELQPRKFKIV